MNKTGHSIGAIGLSALALYCMKENIVKEPLIIVGIVIGSFFPDLDADYSYFNSKCPIIPFIFKIVKKILPNQITKHRGALFHSIWTVILLFAIYINFNNSLLLGMILGVVGHHFLDMLTPAGLRYFYPCKAKFGIRRILK